MQHWELGEEVLAAHLVLLLVLVSDPLDTKYPVDQ